MYNLYIIKVWASGSSYLIISYLRMLIYEPSSVTSLCNDL